LLSTEFKYYIFHRLRPIVYTANPNLQQFQSAVQVVKTFEPRSRNKTRATTKLQEKDPNKKATLQ
jgi:hypothetical protein